MTDDLPGSKKVKPKPVAKVDEEWRKAELEKLMFGEGKKSSRKNKKKDASPTSGNTKAKPVLKVDEEWRKAELEKLMFGEDKKSSRKKDTSAASGKPKPLVKMDDDWRKAELDKMILGEQKKSSAGKYIAIIVFVIFVAFVGWQVFAPGSATPEPVQAAQATAPEPVEQAPPPPPVPVPEPRPYRDLFEVQTAFDGQKYVVYTIQQNDDLFTIGEKLHDVTGVPRLVTHQAVEDAYWRKYFSYDDQNARVTTPEEVSTHIGELLQIPVPLQEYPSFDLAVLVEEYNQS